jgi:soluble lytic murein transglycosylase-like protein
MNRSFALNPRKSFRISLNPRWTVVRQLTLAVTLLAALSAGAAEVAVLQNGFEIRHERREQVGAVTRLYLRNAPDAGYVDIPSEQITNIHHDDTPPPAPPPVLAGPSASSSPAVAQNIDVRQLVSAASDLHRVDPDLISSVIHAESNFNPRALSPKGAQGLMQLMPGTASRLGVADAFQPAANVDGGTRYLRELLLRYHGDVVKALAAYNAGPERVEQYRGVPPYHETHAYVARVVREFNRKKLAQEKARSTTELTARLPAGS